MTDREFKFKTLGWTGNEAERLQAIRRELADFTIHNGGPMGLCEVSVTDVDGSARPCGRDVFGYSWHEGGEHEPLLSMTCMEHANEAGKRMAGLYWFTSHLLDDVDRLNTAMSELLHERNTWARQLADMCDERDAAKEDAQKARHSKNSDEYDSLTEISNLTAERDRARGLAARLEEQVARVEALAVVVANRMMATAKPSEIWAALRGEGACEGSPMCPGGTHAEGCYSLAWTAADWQQCTDSRCLTPCMECAEAALTGAGGE